MIGRGITLRAGEFLSRNAIRRLPAEARDEWFRTFAAELPAILDDPGIQSAFRRQARALLYAADNIRGAWLLRRMSAAPVPASARAVRIAVAVSVGSAAILTVGVITADIRLTLVLSALIFGGLFLASAILAFRVAIAGARHAASRNDSQDGSA